MALRHRRAVPSFPRLTSPALRLASLLLAAGLALPGTAWPAPDPASAPAAAASSAPAAAASSVKATKGPRAASCTKCRASAPASAPRRKGRHGPAAHGASVRDDADPDAVQYGHRDDVMAFAAQVAEARQLDRDWVASQLARARYQPRIARLVMPPPAGTAKNWAAYRARFIEPGRIQAGLQWWQAHEAPLAEAEARFGVPPEIVAGIVGVETYYGRLMGHWRVIDALATLSFDFPAGRSDRRAFYRDELGAWLAWCAREHRDADTTLGSYAGALGWPQFMPSSLFKYAIDFDGDGRVDLDDGGADVIGSVANYLATFGWKRGMPPLYAVTPPEDAAHRAALLAPDILPTFTAAQMTAEGAKLPPEAASHAGPLALVLLQNGDAPPSYVAGTENFYVVTRYNWSAYYAMAVIDLARALRQAHDAAAAKAPRAAS